MLNSAAVYSRRSAIYLAFVRSAVLNSGRVSCTADGSELGGR